jgi:hypothetical protein
LIGTAIDHHSLARNAGQLSSAIKKALTGSYELNTLVHSLFLLAENPLSAIITARQRPSRLEFRLRSCAGGAFSGWRVFFTKH